MKSKITEIKSVKEHTRTARDVNGQSFQETITLESYEPVPLVTGFRRFIHYIIDIALAYLFVIILVIPITVILALMGINLDAELASTSGQIIDRLMSAALLPLYFLTFESILQTTPGKLVTGSLVVNEYGEKPDFLTILKRSYSRIVPFEPLSCLGERGWHDEWSDTYVVNKKQFNELLMKVKINEMGEPNPFTENSL